MIDTLLNIKKNKTSSNKNLSGVKLHHYLQKYVIEFETISINHRSVYDVNPKKLADTVEHLKTGYKILIQSNKKNLCASIEYGIWLNKAFALFNVENMGKYITWKKWITKEIGITDGYARKLRRVATVLGPYARFRHLALSFSEVHGLVKAIEYMLEGDNQIAEYWMHNSTSVGTVPASAPIGPRASDSAVSKPGPVRNKGNKEHRYKPY